MNPPSTAGDPQMGRKKPRMCPHCKRHFRRYEHLQRHIRTHTNEKPYVCTCGASFARRDLLKRHQNVAHALLTPETPRSEAQAPVTSIPWSLSGPSDGLVGAVEEQQGQLSEFNATGEASLFNAYDPLPDFESFTHSLGLTLDWGLPSEPGITSLVAREPSFHVIPTPSSTRYTSQEHPDQSLTQLPAERDSVAEFGVLTLPILRITEDHRNRILQALVQFQATVSDTLLPSSNSLTRFVNAFFDGFYPHAPVVHIPTFNVDDCEAEIFLAMAALGAQYRHEHRKGVWLFYAAKSILQEKAREKERKAINENLFLRGGSPRELPYDELMREARCALYLIVFAMWQTEPEIVREAFNLQSFLATCVRESRLEENQESLQTNTRDWHGWVRQESYRRIKLFSFAFLNLLSIEFNLPPVLLSDEVHLRLPSACIEWISPSAERWAAIYNSGHQNQIFFQDALSQLTKSSKESQLSGSQPVPSPLANYILLQALIQRITLVHQAFRSNGGEEHTLLNTQKEDIRNSLRSWTSQWQRAPESSLDPRNPNGPIPFTSTSLLGLAYTRLAFDMGSYRILQCRDPVQIANRLLVLPGLPRGPHLLPAVLHASHALSIPVKLGVEFVARSRAFVWSIEHSLCGLEFAVFLSKWLYCISGTQSKRPLDEHETRLVDWISDIAEEGRTSSDEDICPGPSSPSDCVHLAFVVVKLWAHLIKGNEQWAILGIIGESLDIYADLCREGQLQAPQERNCVDT